MAGCHALNVEIMVRVHIPQPMNKTVVLIFGDPGAGKSHLAKHLQDTQDYEILSVDSLYLNFIQNERPTLYLPDLAVVVSQHYKTMLGDMDRKAWERYAVSAIKDYIRDRQRIVIEGFLLQPILSAVRSRLPRSINLSVMTVIDGEYFLLTEEMVQ